MIAVFVDGADRTCDTAPEVKSVVGRRSVTDVPGDPGYAALNIESEPLPVAGTLSRIVDDASERHSGWITDAPKSHPYGPDEMTPLTQITSMGPLSRWGRVYVGDVPWPPETVKQRADRIAALVGQPITVMGGAQTVISRDVDRKRAIDLLRELASTTGGWLFDHAGRVYLQALDARAATPTTVAWNDEPPDAAWADADDTWAEQDAPAPMAPFTITCDEALWEPTWTQTTAPLASTVRVTWGIPQPVARAGRAELAQNETSRTDPGALALLGGPVELRIATTLANEADAIDLRELTLKRVTQPRHQLGALQIDWRDLKPETAARLAAALPGARITVTGLPQPAPAATFSGVLEGWEEVWPEHGERLLTLHLSDIAYSLSPGTWADEPAGATWAQADTTWEADL